MPLGIRRAVPADAPIMVEFNRLMAVETESKNLDPALLSAGVAAILADSRKGVYYLAHEADSVLGQLMITTEWSDWRNGWMWWIQSVYVRGDARRRGVFRALYQYVYDLACHDPEVIGLRLYVEQENHAAQRTYWNLGMEPMNFLLFQKYPL